MKIILLYKSMMESNTPLVDPVVPKIVHSKLNQDHVESTYIQVVSY